MNRQQHHAMAPPLAPAAQCHCHRSLGLIDKALPLSAATPPQLRQRRHFKFNGMDFETDPLSLQMASPHNNNSSNKSLEDHVGDARCYSAYGEQAQESPGGGGGGGGGGYGAYKTLSMPAMGARKPTLLTAADAHQMEKLLLQHGPSSNISSSNNKDQLENSSYLSGELEARAAPWRTAAATTSTQPEHDLDTPNGDGGESSAGYCSQQERRVRQVLAKYSRQEPLAVEESFDYDDEENLLKPSNSCCDMLQHDGYQQRHHSYSHGYEDEDETKKRTHLPPHHHHHRSHPSRSPRQLAGYRSSNNNNNRTGGGTVGIRDMVGNSSSSIVGNSKMDYITLTGFLLGYLTSNVLYFLCWYFSWLKGLVINLRKHFLGQTSLWEFFDFEDTTRYSMQRKLMVAPIILVCSILYCVVNILHLLIKLVRSDVPRTVVELVQRTAKSRP